MVQSLLEPEAHCCFLPNIDAFVCNRHFTFISSFYIKAKCIHEDIVLKMLSFKSLDISASGTGASLRSVTLIMENIYGFIFFLDLSASQNKT